MKKIYGNRKHEHPIHRIYFILSIVFIVRTSKKHIRDLLQKIRIIRNNNNTEQFFYVEPQSHSPLHSTDTLAKCTYKRINPEFVELNSTSPNILALQGFKVSQSSDSTLNDAIKVSFSIPYHRNLLRINVFTDSFQSFRLDYTKDSKDLLLPVNTESFSFYIEPEYLIPHTPDGHFYGAVGYDSFQEFEIEKNKNHITIEIPALDDSFFERYFVEGEYAKVSGNTITWKGEVFRKKWEL